MNDILIEDLIEYHYPNKEHLLAEDLIRKNKKFAEALYFELQMQLYLNDTNTEELEYGEEIQSN